MGLCRLSCDSLLPGALVAPAAIISLYFTTAAFAFVPQERWGLTATSLATQTGRPVTLTWSIVPDSTHIQGEGGSNLIQFLDGVFGAGPGGNNLQQRPWFSLLDNSFNRWSEVSGLTFLYEADDDGADHGSVPGLINIRGDVRVGGAFIDGNNGTLAYSFFPSNADMVLDTGDTTFFSNPTENHRAFRNMFMHELGHGIGLDHVVSNTDRFLLEPSINISFEGPQLDDIRGAHWYYGDTLEKSNGGQGNETPAMATNLGWLIHGATRTIGAAAAGDTVVEGSETDFVSIANSADADYFSFEVFTSTGLNAVLTPLGGIFNQGTQGGPQAQFDANARSDLSLAVFGTDGTSLLGFANKTPAGGVESLTGIRLPAAGTYYARVIGSSTIVQMYQLDLTAVAPAALLPGDFNHNGEVDAADFAVWRNSVDETGPGLPADANNDSVVDAADHDIWRANFGATAASTTAVYTSAVPEPATQLLALFVGWIVMGMSRNSRKTTPILYRPV
jgi:serralysin